MTYHEVCLANESPKQKRFVPLWFLVDSAFLHGVKKIFHAMEDINDLIDP